MVPPTTKKAFWKFSRMKDVKRVGVIRISQGDLLPEGTEVLYIWGRVWGPCPTTRAIDARQVCARTWPQILLEKASSLWPVPNLSAHV